MIVYSHNWPNYFLIMAPGPGKRNIDKLNDEDLIGIYSSSGNIDVLGVLFERYIDLVYGVCLKYYKNRERSRDGVMDIFEKLVHTLRGNKVNNFRSWLYVLTKNHCLMDLRSEGSRQLVNMDDYDHLIMENGDDLHPIDKEGGIIDEVLEYCIEKLKKEQQSCVRLFYFENRCYNDIAEMLGLEEKKVKSYLQNAKRNLKICMEENYEKG